MVSHLFSGGIQLIAVFLLMVRVVVGACGGVCDGVSYIVGGTMRVIGGWGLGRGSG